MDFTLSPEIEDLRVRTRAFVEEHVLPLESDPENFSEHENIPLARLVPVRAKARAAGLWAPQAPKEFGGMALPIVSWAVMYEEAARSVFGALAFKGVRVNAIAPGWFVTDINRDYLSSEAGKKLTRDIPVGRFGQDGDLDGALLLLASDAGAYMAGTTVVCDGGQMVALRG